MPIYEYECTSCNHNFDLIQKINEEPIKECPSCHKETAVKLISAAGFQLKGSGWYVTDFKNKDNKTTAKPKETGTTVDSTATSSTESKKTIKDAAE